VLLDRQFVLSTRSKQCASCLVNGEHRAFIDMISWRSLDENLNIRQVRWTLCLLYFVHILLFHAACGATRSCSRSNPVNVRVATVFSECVVRARLLAVHTHNKSDTGLTLAQFRLSRVFKSLRYHPSTVFTAGVLESDLTCIRINSSCLVFVNMSVSVPYSGIRNDSAASDRVSRLSPWSRKALRYVRLHICQSQYCSK